MIRRALLSTAVAFAAVGTARAEPAPPLPKAETQSLVAFATANGSCREWSDGCVVCRRQTGAAIGCSTPGIACQPSKLACRDPTSPVSKGKP